MGSWWPLRRWQVIAPVLLGLSLAGTVAGCALVQSDLGDRSRAALAARGIDGVSVDLDYRTATLRGPAALRDRALAAVEGVRGVRSASYSVAGGAGAGDGTGITGTSTTSTTGTAASTTTAAPAVPAAARPRAVQRRLDALLAGTTIRFATASADISPASRPLVDRAARVIAPALRGNPKLRVRVEGHTDNVGDAARNLALSRRRADAVVAALAARGVPRRRLAAVGYGDTRPVGDNSTDAGRTANRRIAFRVIGS